MHPSQSQVMLLNVAAFKNISDLTGRLIDELKNLSPNRDPEDGWRLLESTLSRAEVGSLQSGLSMNFMAIKQLQQYLSDIQSQDSIVSILEAVSNAVYLASTAPDSLLPKRRNIPRAKHNQLILALRRYLKHHFNTESPSTIATIVNAAFESADGGITADDVRKLKY